MTSTLVICRRVARKRFGAVVVRLRTEFVRCAAAVCFQLLIIFILSLAHYVFELSVRLCVRACVPAPGGGIAVEFYFSYSYSYLSVICLFPSVL